MIRFEDVKKSFRRAQVLAGVTLEVQTGERVALVGANGAGKTTLIRCLIGEYVCQGRVSIDGLFPREQRRELLTKVGFVPQQPPPLAMPVGQLLKFAARVSGSDPGRMAAVAARLGFDVETARRLPFVKLSGGQKQKLLIAIALGRDCSVLILDEPASNLDPDGRRMFFELLSERVEDATMLLSSHRLDEIASLVNRVIELDCGKVVLDDRVLDETDLSAVLRCRLKLHRAEDAVAKTLMDWGFQNMDHGLEWEGRVPAPDRLRFLGVLSRYAALLRSVALDETGAEES